MDQRSDPQQQTTGQCEECKERPGEPTETDKRGIVMLCSTCFAARLRRRLSWGRYFGPTAICALMVPALALFVGSAAEIIGALRFGGVPYTDRTVGDAFANGWNQLSSATANLETLVAIAAIAVALPASLASTVSSGARIAGRLRAATVMNLDDHVRLARLDRVLGVQTVVAMCTTVLAFVVVADSVIDGGPGWATTALLGLLFTIVLMADVDRIGTFANFAEQTRLLVKADIALAVKPHRDPALRRTGRQGASAAVVTLVTHTAGLLVACLPHWYEGVTWGILSVILAIPLGLALAGVAYPYLRHGDRASAVITVSLGAFLGITMGALTYQVSFVTNPQPAFLISVLVGSALYLPLYVVLALGVCGIGPLRWLGYFTVKLDRATYGVDRAMRRWLQTAQ